MPNFRVKLHRTAIGGPIRVLADVDGRTDSAHLLTDEQLRERLGMVFANVAEIEAIFTNLGHGLGEHRLSFPAAEWPVIWNSPEDFFEYWRPGGGPGAIA